ncbi:L,D-transpeptidase [Microvirga aerilata]|uniref:L,D-transpeptidase n=1 Tax=Microvirga aerilata TaxID=670292 RepID=A0A936ZE77_9HYPH|nr:L,D-transpeptidase [Microvirga aerilata]MBL0408206.1 L,D-transpeptidase [Microvirga aerilata]
MRRAISSIIALLGGIVLAGPAVAEVSIVVDKTTQRMTVFVDGQQRYSWPVSTGTADYSTPVGTFTPSRLARAHYSREWDNAPMPHSIFLTDAGHAIHGSRAISHLGTPASHGCVRLAPRHASILFDLVMVEGPENTRVEITGMDPIGTRLAGANGAGGDYSRLTSFDPLTNGIMAGSSVGRSQADISRNP